VAAVAAAEVEARRRAEARIEGPGTAPRLDLGCGESRHDHAPVLDRLDVHAPPRRERRRSRRSRRDEANGDRPDEARRPRRRDHRRNEWHGSRILAEAAGLVAEADQHDTEARYPIEGVVHAAPAVDDAAFGPNQLTAS